MEALRRLDRAARADRDRQKLSEIIGVEIPHPWPGLPAGLADPDRRTGPVAAALLDGCIVVGASFEERTLAYWQVAQRVAPAGLSVHLVTPDDDSAQRVYEALQCAAGGELAVSLVTSETSYQQRAFTANIVIGPMTTVAVSYLFDAIDELPSNRMQRARDLLVMEQVDRLLLGDAEQLEAVLADGDNQQLDGIPWDSYPLLYRSAVGACDPLTDQQADRLEGIVGYGRVERRELRPDAPHAPARFRRSSKQQGPDDLPPRPMDEPADHLLVWLRERFAARIEVLLLDAHDAEGRRRIVDRWIEQVTNARQPPHLKDAAIDMVPSLRRLAPELVDASDVRNHIYDRLDAKESRLGDALMTRIALRAVQTFSRSAWADYRKELPEAAPASSVHQLGTFAANTLDQAVSHVVEDVTRSLLYFEPSFT